MASNYKQICLNSNSTRKVIMELQLIRSVFTSKSTIGKLYVDGKFQCYTLEDVVRTGPKIAHETAIPEGRFRVAMGYSPKFHKKMPRVENVPGFSGILIHTGNKPADTWGCILVGTTAAANWIGASRIAYNALATKIKAATSPIWLTITSTHVATS